MTDRKSELDDLPELPDMAELEPLPEIPDLPDSAELDVPEMPDSAVLERDAIPAKPAPKAVEKPKVMPAKPKPLAKAKPVPKAKPAPKPVVAAKPAPKVAKPEPVAVEKPTPEPKAAELVETTVAALPDSVGEVASAAAGVAPGALAPGEKPPLRELENSLKHLALASKLVVVGALCPFMKSESMADEGTIWFSLAAKLVVLGAAYIWAKQVFHNWGPKLPGLMGRFADLNLMPKPKEEPEDTRKGRRAPAKKKKAAGHPFPTGLHLLSILLVVVAVMLSMRDPRINLVGPVGPAEMGILAWAAFTYVHILAYERWGSFNPIMPLMFLAMLFGGFASALGGFAAEGLTMVGHVAGGLLVGCGGGLAAYTIVEAMMQAKKEGDVKKAAAIELRKATRASRRK